MYFTNWPLDMPHRGWWGDFLVVGSRQIQSPEGGEKWKRIGPKHPRMKKLEKNQWVNWLAKGHTATWYQSEDLISRIEMSLAAPHSAAFPTDQKPLCLAWEVLTEGKRMIQKHKGQGIEGDVCHQWKCLLRTYSLLDTRQGLLYFSQICILKF